GLTTVASGLRRYRDRTAVAINSSHSALHVAKLAPEGRPTVDLPEAPYVHVFVARGAVEMEGTGRLDVGDAVRLTFSGGQRLTALEPAEVLIWEMHARLGAG
ncbi:MAG: pirin family protein, partial [Nocardia sp.]|nr:pirin family protein [Nocardia sp.]